MSEMVTRVARVLEPQAWAALGTGDTLAYENRRKSSLRKARAAIQALRDPPARVLDAMQSYAQCAGYIPEGWNAAIDSILQD